MLSGIAVRAAWIDAVMYRMRDEARESTKEAIKIQTVYMESVQMSECKYNTIFVVSPDDQSGKSTFANELGAALGLKVGETGHHIDRPLARVLAAFWTEEAHAAHDVDVALAALAHNKEKYRAHKIVFANEMCRLDPDWMIQQSIEDGARIIVGCRRPEEIKAYIDSVPFRFKVLLIIIYRTSEGQPVNAAVNFLKLKVETREINNAGDANELRATAWAVAADVYPEMVPV